MKRCLEEQTVEAEDGSRLRLRTKEDGETHSSILQNPADPEATYRQEAGKDHQGWVANVEETVGVNGSVVTDYFVEPTQHCDSNFLKETLKKIEPQQEKTTIVANTAYNSDENRKPTARKTVDLVTTGLAGKEPLQFSPTSDGEGKQVVRCPQEYAPVECLKLRRDGDMPVRFPVDQCAGCPHKDECGARIGKKYSSVRISVREHRRARIIKQTNPVEQGNYGRLRTGVETVPAATTNTCDVDRIQTQGLAKPRIFFGCKAGALNVHKLIAFRTGRGEYAKTPVLKGIHA